jgi:hypothetical protein
LIFHAAAITEVYFPSGSVKCLLVVRGYHDRTLIGDIGQ